MKTTSGWTLAVSLLAAFATGSTGCKTTPKIAWWQKSTADAAAVAEAVPKDPAEAAKLAEAATAPAASQLTAGPSSDDLVNQMIAGGSSDAGGTAAPFVPEITAQPTNSQQTATLPPYPGTYPTTGVTAGSAEQTATAVAAVTRDAVPQQNSAHLGKLSMPYDPSKVPAIAGTAMLAQQTPVANRYAPANSTAAGNSYAATQAPGSSPDLESTISASDPYGDRYAAPSVASSAASADRYDRYASAAPASQSVDPQPNSPGLAATALGGVASSPTTPAAQMATSQIAASGMAASGMAASGMAASGMAQSEVDRYGLPAGMSEDFADVEVGGGMTSDLAASGANSPAASGVASATQAAGGFRPGGTSSYPGAFGSGQSVEQVATRPRVTPGNTTSPYATGTGSAAGGSTAPPYVNTPNVPAATPPVQRY
jgi:hypothetical protein